MALTVVPFVVLQLFTLFTVNETASIHSLFKGAGGQLFNNSVVIVTLPFWLAQLLLAFICSLTVANTVGGCVNISGDVPEIITLPALSLSVKKAVATLQVKRY